MKEAFSVEEEGYDQNDENAEENLMASFLDYIKKNKVGDTLLAHNSWRIDCRQSMLMNSLPCSS